MFEIAPKMVEKNPGRVRSRLPEPLAAVGFGLSLFAPRRGFGARVDIDEAAVYLHVWPAGIFNALDRLRKGRIGECTGAIDQHCMLQRVPARGKTGW